MGASQGARNVDGVDHTSPLQPDNDGEVEEKVVVHHSYSSSKDVGDGNTMEGSNTEENFLATVEAPFLFRQGVKRRGRLVRHWSQPL